MKLELRIRNLKSGEEGLATFETEAEAHVWLAKRPPFVEVLGLATWGVPGEISTRLRTAMRPLDDDERLAKREADLAAEKAALEAAKTARAREVEAQAKHKAALNADPDRPMDIHWTYDGGMKKSDEADDRPLTDEVRDAVMAWIAERTDWVKDRGQIVGEANVSVYPGKVPSGAEGERVRQGTFFPCTAPDPKQAN